jgi:hypothetical protein
MQGKSNAAPMTTRAHTEWFHGSPLELTSLRAGSTVTPIPALAKAFAHKPSSLNIQVHEDTDNGKRNIEISHNGTKPGYLYRVAVNKPARDLAPHPGAVGAPGEEVLTTRELALDFVEELSVTSAYKFTEPIQ